jgi:hypothetical protein
VVEGDNLSGVPVPNQKDSYFEEVMMGAMLRREWYELLLPQIWKESLASDCAWAFQKGLAALLSRTFQGMHGREIWNHCLPFKPHDCLHPCCAVPIHDIDQEDGGIILDTESLSNTTEWTEEAIEESNKFLSQLVEKKLCKLYEEVDPSKIELRLFLKPAQYRLEHIVAVNFTRDTIAKDESLMEVGRSMRYASRVANDPRDVRRSLNDLNEKGKTI